MKNSQKGLIIGVFPAESNQQKPNVGFCSKEGKWVTGTVEWSMGRDK